MSPLCASLRFCSNTPIDESGSVSAKNERLVLISVILGSKTAEVYDFSLIIFACMHNMIQHVWYLIPVNDCNTQNCKPLHLFAWGKSSQGSWEPRCCIRYLSLWSSHQMFLVFHFLFSLHIDHQNYTVVAVNQLTVNQLLLTKFILKWTGSLRLHYFHGQVLSTPVFYYNYTANTGPSARYICDKEALAKLEKISCTRIKDGCIVFSVNCKINLLWIKVGLL